MNAISAPCAVEAIYSVDQKQTTFTPSSVLVLSSDEICVTDEINHQIIIFDSELNKQRVICNFGKNARPFRYPVYMNYDPEGNILVADKWNHALHYFDSNLQYIRSFGQYGHAIGSFSEPTSFAFLGNNMYVCERSNNRVQAFSLDGNTRAVYQNHSPVPQYYEGRDFKKNTHYRAWLSQCVRLHTVEQQFFEHGFRVGMIEYPVWIVATPMRTLLVLDQVNDVIAEFSETLAFLRYHPVSNRIPQRDISCMQFDLRGYLWIAYDNIIAMCDQDGNLSEHISCDCEVTFFTFYENKIYIADVWHGIIKVITACKKGRDV